jgi:Type II secretion system (T2SS), protein N
MLGKRSLVALGSGAYLAFVLAQFPAGTAYRWFAPDSVVLSGVSGTVWAGRAALASVGGLPMRELEWDLAALPLLIGRASGHISGRFADGFVDTSAMATMRTLNLTDLELATSLDTLGVWLPLQGARGSVSVNLEELTLRNTWPLSIVGTVRVGQLEVPPLVPGGNATLVPLGSYELTNFELAERRLAAQLRDTDGPLEVSGAVTLALPAAGSLQGAVPSFDGRVRERADLPAALREPLEFLTAEIDGSGWRTLNLDPWLQSL